MDSPLRRREGELGEGVFAQLGECADLAQLVGDIEIVRR
jgi:hypothetical protein